MGETTKAADGMTVKEKVINHFDFGSHNEGGEKGGSMFDPNLAFMSGRGYDGGFGGGFGTGIFGGILGGALLRNGGLFGGNGDVGAASALQLNNIQQGVTALTGAVPTQTAQIQNTILSQTNDINQAFANQNLAMVAAFNQTNQNINGVKDAVNAGVNELTVLIKDNTITQLQADLARATAEAAEARSANRSRETEINISNVVTQTQAQAQFQNQMAATLSSLVNQMQEIKQGQVIFNSGTMAASGTQAAANTRVA